jgi:hypothetical protein
LRGDSRGPELGTNLLLSFALSLLRPLSLPFLRLLSLSSLRPPSLPSLLSLLRLWLHKRTMIIMGVLGVMREGRKRKKKMIMGKFFILISSWIM